MDTKNGIVRMTRRRLVGGLGAAMLVAAVAPATALAAGGPKQETGSRQPGRQGGSVTPPIAQAPSGTTLDAKTAEALARAIEDEYKARATYEAVIAKFGSVRPFSNIVRAEESHIAALTRVFSRYGLPLPQDEYRGRAEAPATLKEACGVGVQAEIDNAAMYDRFLEYVTSADVVGVFTQLRDASRYNHLPAFQRWA